MSGIEIHGPVTGRVGEILTDAALAFLADLHRTFDARRLELLAARAERQEKLAAGALPDFLPETEPICEGHRQAPPPPADLLTLRESTGVPADRKRARDGLHPRTQ